jgi:prefoldin subunit 5
LQGLDDASESIRKLETEKQQLLSMKRVRERESETLNQYSQSMNSEHVAPDAMLSFLTKFVERGQNNIEKVAHLDERILEVDRSIEVEQAKTTLKKGALNGEVVVVLGSKMAIDVNMTLTYSEWISLVYVYSF